jgi:hypothetical protein
MKLSKFSKLLTPMYTDIMTVYRTEPKENSDGTTSVKLSETPVYEDIPCRISTTKADNSESTADDTNPQYSEIKVFCAPDYVIRKGDKIVAVKKQDDGTTLITYTGTANLPFAFVTHKEIVLAEVGDA